MSPVPAGEVPHGATARATRDRLLATLGPLVSTIGYDLEDVTVTSAGRRSLVRVSVDADGGIDLDAVAEVSRLISDALDADDPFSGPFVLEVGSPGVDRPLTEERHWRRAAGRLVTAEVAGKPLTARVLSAERGVVTFDVGGGTEREVRLTDLGAGKIQVEFNRKDAVEDLTEDDENDTEQED